MAEPVLAQLSWAEYDRLEVVFADSAYQGPLEDWAAEELGLWLLIVPKLAGQSRFVPLPKRWIVERTFSWLLKCRRLSRDYEALPESSEAWIRLATIGFMLRRLCDLMRSVVSTPIFPPRVPVPIPPQASRRPEAEQ